MKEYNDHLTDSSENLIWIIWETEVENNYENYPFNLAKSYK